jgi:hypothetical protein
MTLVEALSISKRFAFVRNTVLTLADALHQRNITRLEIPSFLPYRASATLFRSAQTLPA